MPAVRNWTDVLVRLVARCDTAAAMRPRHHPLLRLLRLLLVAGVLAAGLVPGGVASAGPAPRATPGPEGVRARYAILVDPATGAVLWGRRSRTAAPPASLTKMLTALAVRASLDLDGVTVPRGRRPASRPAAWP
jgi:D-alanyl-D-alanine carboxypeptidase